MARPPLHDVLSAIPGVTNAWLQGGTNMEYPCIVYEPSPADVSFADSIKYRLKKGWSVIVIDRSPDSLIPEYVEGLPYSTFQRFYRLNGLNHYVFQLFY